METIIYLADVNRRKSENIASTVVDIFYTLFQDDRLEASELPENPIKSSTSIEENLRLNSSKLDQIFSLVSNMAGRVGANVPEDEFGVVSVPGETIKSHR